jgi:hypothetical protein
VDFSLGEYHSTYINDKAVESFEYQLDCNVLHIQANFDATDDVVPVHLNNSMSNVAKEAVVEHSWKSMRQQQHSWKFMRQLHPMKIIRIRRAATM